MKQILVKIAAKKCLFVSPQQGVHRRNGINFFWFLFEGKRLCATQENGGLYVVRPLLPIVETIVTLRSQFHNIWEGIKPASLTYAATYTGNDAVYKKNYGKNLIEEIARQADFWECVMNFNESYSVEVKVVGVVEEKEKLEKHLISLVLADLKTITGKDPDDSFLSYMTQEDHQRIEEGVAYVRKNFPMLTI